MSALQVTGAHLGFALPSLEAGRSQHIGIPATASGAINRLAPPQEVCSIVGA
jgi:hypothetical protein